MFLRKDREKLEKIELRTHCNLAVERQLRIEIFRNESIRWLLALEDIEILRKIYNFIHKCTKNFDFFGETDYRAKMIDLILNLKNPKIIQSCYVFISDIAREDGDVNE